MPWPQVRAFEQMWSMQALSLDAASAQPKYEASSRAMQYLKVGAAAVGGGALLAVTGGLAAPAIAAGLGAAVSLAHGEEGVPSRRGSPARVSQGKGKEKRRGPPARGRGSPWWVAPILHETCKARRTLLAAYELDAACWLFLSCSGRCRCC